MSTITLVKTALIYRKGMFKIGCYLVVQAPFINLRNIGENSNRSVIFLRKLWLFFMCRWDVHLFQFVGKSWKTNWTIDVIIYVLRKNLCIFSKISFCAAYFRVKTLERFFDFFDDSLNLKKNVKVIFSLD